MTGFGKLKASMSKVSGEDIIRGSSNIPLSAEGRKQAQEIGTNLASRSDRFDSLTSSDLKRAEDTAKAIEEHCDVTAKTNEALQPWHLGGIEGQPTRDVLDEMCSYIVDTPDKAPPGRGKISTSKGESFNSFKDRFLQHMYDMTEEFDGKSIHLIVTHFRNIKALQAWLKAGMKSDLSVDTKEMLRKDGEPGDVQYFAPMGSRWRMVEDSGKGTLKPGIYVIRHGLTDWNGESYGQPGTHHSGYAKLKDGE